VTALAASRRTTVNNVMSNAWQYQDILEHDGKTPRTYRLREPKDPCGGSSRWPWRSAATQPSRPSASLSAPAAT
jgi:hypothetical protein